jgi:CarD family transcriptional regulator
MFVVGDAVYHPAHGAGVIANLRRMPALRKGQQFYRIRMLAGANTTLLVPVAKAEELGLRPAATKNQVIDVIRILSSEPVILPETHKQRYSVCQEKLDAADTMRTAEVVRDLTMRRIQHDHLNVPGRHIFKKAMGLLAGELALAQGVTLAEAKEQINEALTQRITSA